MRIVFMGSPDFALPTLRRLIESENEIVGVFTQPDRPVGRGQKLSPPPVKALAVEHRLPIFQPKSISKPESVDELQKLGADVAVLAAYGQILKQPVLDAFPHGVLNVHASLLPRWRGAAPVPAAILAGDEVTGATIMLVRLQLDAGPILDSVSTRIQPEDTAVMLTKKIADAGAELLMRVLPGYVAGDVTPREQDESQATYAPSIKKSDALVDWERDDAETVARKVRAFNPWPGAFSYVDGKPLRILECIPLQHRFEDKPGTVFALAGVGEPNLFGAGFGVVAREGEVGVVSVQGPGGKKMLAADYVNGHRDIVGKRLTAAVNGR